MLNIFYEPGYAKRRKPFFNLRLSNSQLFNYLIEICYIFTLPVPKNMIKSGPLKLMNNVVRAFKGDNLVAWNKIQYENSYIVQFDKFGEDILKKIILEKNINSKVLVGPLFTTEQFNNLIKYVEKHEFINILIPSESAKNSLVNELNIKVDKKRILVFPIGIESKKNIKYKKNIRNEECLIYFKNRLDIELEQVTNFLEAKGIQYRIMKYGQYENKKLKLYSKTNKYGILLCGTESQGFAVQEMMLQNLPLYVWDKKTGYFEGNLISGTSVSLWNDLCGAKVENFEDFKLNFENFLNNLNTYQPQKLINENLTFEKFKENLLASFN